MTQLKETFFLLEMCGLGGDGGGGVLKCPPCLARAILQDKLVHCEGTDAAESALHTVGGVLATQGGGVTKQAGGPV